MNAGLACALFPPICGHPTFCGMSESESLFTALRMRDAMRGLNEERKTGDLTLKIGIHEGPCLAVMLNERQDYFGQTVNIASRVQHLASSRAIYATGSVVGHEASAQLLAQTGAAPVLQQHQALRGIADDVPVYEIP